MDDWLKDTQDFSVKKDSSGNEIPLTQSKLNKENSKNIDINDAFDQIANHYVEYKNVQQPTQKPQVNLPKETSVDKNIQNQKNESKKNKKKFTQQKVRKQNDYEDDYDDEYNDEYDDLIDKYK